MLALTVMEELHEDCLQVVILTDTLSVQESMYNCKLPSRFRSIGQRISQTRWLTLK